MSKHNGLERNCICDNPLQMLSMWHVATSVKQVTCEHSHQRLRKLFPVHPGVPLLYSYFEKGCRKKCACVNPER